jgi:hypothetical protein
VHPDAHAHRSLGFGVHRFAGEKPAVGDYRDPNGLKQDEIE